jgi:cytochrome c-type biogenesis protein CcmH/NrfG
MKAEEMLIQYVWIIVIGLFLVIAGVCLYPDKKNRLEFIEERLKEVELKQRVLTEQEKALEKLATEKEWEEVDKDNK